ncbi:peptidylprolyl isomerase [uncultured Campylobacter sp.]|uniref:peptidylprolyl isomerase n=1 Tax=uncultured Campylobacter sp. TaxID=218934 RepID=UPI002623781D|nr:peptidylprolyl isomerase [uncultured Campylobacter sp.]
MKKTLILTALLLSFSSLNAKVINRVVALVNNQPITEYEIKQLTKRGLNRGDAINILIDQKLLDSQIKRLNIIVTPYEIDYRIAQIKRQNKINDAQFQAELIRQKISMEQLRDQIEDDLKKEKLYGALFAELNSQISDEKIRAFYEQNIDLFSSYKTISVSRFFAATKEELENLIKTGKKGPEVVERDLELATNELDPQTAALFGSIPNGKFTDIIPSLSTYFEVIRINHKSGLVKRPFKEVKEEVGHLYMQELRKIKSNEYFETLRSKAVVKFVDRKTL